MKFPCFALACALIVGLAFSTPVCADEPAITLLSPAGFQRGTEAEVVIQGARLGDATQLLLYDEGVEVLELKPDGDTKVNVKLKISESCQPGLHPLRLASETGISGLRYFSVSPLPQIAEVEPNSDFSEPQTIALNSTLNGIVKTEDVDYYAVELAEGQNVTVEIEGLRLGTEFFDPFVAILDTNRFEVARSDDAPLLQQDCVCSYRAKVAGKYIIEVRESAFGGNDRCQYRMHVGDFPRPLSVIPAGGRPGELIEARIVDASGETWTESIQLPDTPGEFNFIAQRDGKVAPSPNKLRVVDLPNVLESEPDDDRAAIAAVDTPVAFNGTLEKSGDTDWFKIKGKKDQTLRFTVYGRRVLRSPIDSWLEIHKATGGQLANNDDAGGPDSGQDFKFPEDGEYLIAIRDQLKEGSPIHAYRIEVAPAPQSLTLGVLELQRYISQTVEVPQGSQMAVMLRANRQGFSGDLALRLEGEPAGVELATPTIAANQSSVPMMIKAAKDAAPNAALVNLIAETLPEGPGITGVLDQRTMLVRGQNNRDMWGHDANRLAMAVTKEVPFSIELIQPQVPLVRGGITNYVVKAHRKEGYKETIYLRALYDPSGCSASASIRIAPDSNEALIPVTANDKAAIGHFPITVLARAKSVNASAWIASEFIDLEIADAFFAFKFDKTVIETGNSGVIAVGLEVNRPPEGEVEFEVVGLPAGVTSDQPKLTLQADMTQLAFPVSVAADAKAGQFKTIFVRATITRPNGQIVQMAGQGEVQLATPIVNTAIAAAAVKPAAAPKSKPLSRLEQLRQAKGLLEGNQQ